ncbi:hypothetical protein ZTR_07057 [Talaromyces verruculosus]|nr:hypothetical protein ZTR_07057 [Talaromyces verruculosus]
MSAIRHFDTPHIIRFGMINDNPGTSEMQFWRNGVHFKLRVYEDDVRGTDFEQQWKPLLKQDPILLRAGLWSELCDLLISHCMEILQVLAPNIPYWTSLHDYFYCKSYTLRLYGAPESGVIPRVVHGPTSTCAYEMQPAAWNTFNVPDDIPIYDCHEASPLDHGMDLKNAPQKVRLSDGTVAFFIPSRISTRRREGPGYVNDVNESHQSIASYFLLHSLQIRRSDDSARIPKVLGILHCSGRPDADMQREDGKQIAGILLEWIDGFRLINYRLGAYCHITAQNESNHAKWRQQVSQVIKELRQHGVSTLGVDISPFDIIIDQNDNHAWLTGFINTEVSEGHREGKVGESDQVYLQLVFDQWLSEEAHVLAPNPREIKKIEMSRWFTILDSIG